MIVDVQGDRTGRVWRYDIVDRLEYSGDRYMATAMDDGSHACLHICEIGTYWEDEIERMRSSIAIASLNEKRPLARAPSAVESLATSLSSLVRR